VDDERGVGAPGGPPPPPSAPGESAPPPPLPPAAPPSVPGTGGQPGWQPYPAAPGPQGWVSPDEVPAEWGAPSPSAQVGWDRPAPGNNGCLRACLIVGGILAVVVVVGGIVASILVGQLVGQIQEDPEAVFGGECQLVSSFEVSDALGEDVEVQELSGLMDTTMGALLDKRLLPDATDCWIFGQSGTSGRVAVVDRDAQTVFATSRAEAQASFFLTDLRDIGDEAFCTTLDNQGSAGILVRFGERVAYVSLLTSTGDAEDDCDRAKVVARTLEP
jgi:hypothetical protein